MYQRMNERRMAESESVISNHWIIQLAIKRYYTNTSSKTLAYLPSNALQTQINFGNDWGGQGNEDKVERRESQSVK